MDKPELDLQSLKFSIPLTQLTVPNRDQCPKCKARKKLYCYNCLEVVTPSVFPATKVVLPFKLHIVLHPGEGRGKATSLHAPVLCAPGCVDVMTYPDLPSCLSANPDTTLLSYPSEQSKLMVDIPNIQSFTDVVFIDSTWRQSYSISHDEKVVGALHHVKLNQYKTMFWRFQDKDMTYLATIEAIYFFLREHFSACTKTEYDGRYDDVMLLFAHQYATIQKYYKEDREHRVFTKRHREGDAYIKE
eukprot:PhF_6_TR20794/c0_g1_i2/m.29858